MQLEIDIRLAAKQLSATTLEYLYAKTFDEISDKGTYARDIAKRTFSWLLCSQEALDPEAFLTAVALEDHRSHPKLILSDLLALCHGLVIVDPTINVLRFAHISFQEFLKAKSDFSVQINHGLAASRCLNMCIEGRCTGMQHGLNIQTDFYQYSALYWPRHWQAASYPLMDEALSRNLEEFIFDEDKSSPMFINWLEDIAQASEHLERDHPLKKATGAIPNSSDSPLFVASTFGLAKVIDVLSTTNDDYDWNQKNKAGQTGLYLASANGNHTIVNLLLEHGAPVSPSGGKYGTPLQAAAFAGHGSVVQILLEYGASGNEKGFFKDALHASCVGGHEEVAVKILNGGFYILSQGKYDEVLEEAAQAGFIRVVERLQELHAPSLGHPGPAQSTAVRCAILKGRVALLERFLRTSSARSEDVPIDALSLAALGGHDEIIELLLAKGYDIEQESRLYGPHLRSASLKGHESSVRLLLERGANINACENKGGALQAASMQGYLSIVRLLVQNGADPNLSGGMYGTAIQAAAYRGHRDVVEDLLDAGARIGQEGVLRDAFHAASEGGHEDIIRLFIEKGFEYHHHDFSFRNCTSQIMFSRPASCSFSEAIQRQAPTHYINYASTTAEKDFRTHVRLHPYRYD